MREKGGRPSPALLSARTRAMAAATTRLGGGGGFRGQAPGGGAVERPVARAAGEAGQGRSQGRDDGAGHLRGDRRRQRRGAVVRSSRGRPAAEAARTRLGAQANPVR